MISSRTYVGAGELNPDFITVNEVALENMMIRLGKISTAGMTMKDLFLVIVDHPSSSLSFTGIISVGHSSASQGQIKFQKAVIKGNVNFYYDKETLEYYIRPLIWDKIYIKKIFCQSDFTFEKVKYDESRHILMQ